MPESGSSTPPPLPLKPLYRIAELPGAVLPFSRSRIYELVRAGRLKTVTEHGTRMVTARAIIAYIELLEMEAEAA